MDDGRAKAATVMPARASVRSLAPEYADSDRANGTNRVVIGGRLSDAKARRPWYASLNGFTRSFKRTGRRLRTLD
jgi:hypothetical protein